VKFLEPKPKSGKRMIDLDEITLQLLRGHYKHLQSELLASGRKWEEHGLIFTRSISSQLHPRNLLREFYTLLEDAGYHVNIYIASGIPQLD
jgi:hypothetical protein